MSLVHPLRFLMILFSPISATYTRLFLSVDAIAWDVESGFRDILLMLSV